MDVTNLPPGRSTAVTADTAPAKSSMPINALLQVQPPKLRCPTRKLADDVATGVVDFARPAVRP
jgi:hypothetical protein